MIGKIITSRSIDSQLTEPFIVIDAYSMILKIEEDYDHGKS
jgi:hypothetical protein